MRSSRPGTRRGKLALHEEFPDACIEAIAPFLGEDAADH
jgi:hypothetical protein